MFKPQLLALFLAATFIFGGLSCIQKTTPAPLKEVVISGDVTLTAFNKDGLNLLGEIATLFPQGKWPTSSLWNDYGVYCSDLFYLDTDESIHVVVSSDNHLYGHPLMGCIGSNNHISGILIDVIHINMYQSQVGLSSRISGYTNCNYRQVGSIFETSFDLTTAEPGFFAVTLTNEDELRPHNCHIEIQKSNKVAEQRSGPITVNIGSVILSIGLALAVMGLRFIMVKNSLKGGKPLDERLKTLKKEFLAFLIAGGAIFLIGILGPYLALSVEISKVFANAGGVIFGLGIPQYTQWKYGQGTDAQVKESLKRVKKWTYLTLVPGVALIIISGFISV